MLKIRKLKLDDSDKLNNLFTKLVVFERVFSSNIVENIQTIGDYKNILKDDKSLIMVAEIDNDLVGFIYIYEKVLDEIFINKEAFIEAMYVNDEYQNQGIGKKLFNECLKWSKKRNIKIIDIDVMCYNKNAIKAYEKYGFREIKKGMRFKI